MEAKRNKEALDKAQAEREKRDEELSHMTPEERELKRQHDKWRREYEREQNAIAEKEELLR